MFLYSTLPSPQSIRLLRLHPGADDEQISCSLHIIDNHLTSTPYLALSYCWGDNKDLVELPVDKKKLLITKSLYAALHRLRQNQHLFHASHQDQISFIWADAICIDQDNISERNQQVSIMNTIFQQAAQVAIWIGPGDDRTTKVMAMIQKLVHTFPKDSNTRGSTPFWLSIEPAINDGLKLISLPFIIQATDFPIADWQSFWNFYHSDWFFRIWVIQEVHRHKNVKLLCGRHQIDWDSVGLAATRVWLGAIRSRTTHWKEEYFPTYNGFVNTNFMWNQSFSTRRQAPFLALLHYTRPFKATDARDKVFATLHYCVHLLDMDETGSVITNKSYPIQNHDSTSTHLNLVADYTMSTYEIYREVALQSLEQYQNLEVFCYAWQTQHHDVSWPSWIPRWTISNNWPNPILLPFLYAASGIRDIDYRMDPNSSALQVKGLELGSITEVSPVAKYSSMASQHSKADASTTRDKLMTVMRLLTQDRWQHDLTNETAAHRNNENSGIQFASFSSYILDMFNDHEDELYISLIHIWCDICGRVICSSEGPLSTVHSSYYFCNICVDGDFDLCIACYDGGIRCHDADHTLSRSKPTALSIPYTTEIVKVLKDSLVDGKDALFQPKLNKGLMSASFFHTAQGYRGTASRSAQVGDVVVVFFGSRVPFIVRKHQSGYRLISHCYLDGFMDGRAIEMLKKGELEAQEFKIV